MTHPPIPKGHDAASFAALIFAALQKISADLAALEAVPNKTTAQHKRCLILKRMVAKMRQDHDLLKEKLN